VGWLDNNLELDSDSSSSGTLTPPLEMANANVNGNAHGIEMKALPEKFSGLRDGQEVGQFLDAFARAAQINVWTDQEQVSLLPLFLKDTALKWYTAQVQLRQGQNAFVVWADALRATFQVGIADKFEALENRKFLSTESPESYFYDIMIMIDNYGGNANDEMRLHYLKRGLPEDLQEKVTLLDPQTPAQFKSVLKRIHKSFEQAYSANIKKNNTQVTDLEIKEVQVEMNQEIRKLRRELESLKIGNRERTPVGNRYPYNDRAGNSGQAYGRGYNYAGRQNSWESNRPFYEQRQMPESQASQGAVPRRVRFDAPMVTDSGQQVRNGLSLPKCYICLSTQHLRNRCPQNPNNLNQGPGNGLGPAAYHRQ
jgi:hypothetical protein